MPGGADGWLRHKHVFPSDGSYLVLTVGPPGSTQTVEVDADILTRDDRPAIAAWIDHNTEREEMGDRLRYRAALPTEDAASVRLLCAAIEADRMDLVPSSCALALAWGLSV